MKKIIYLGVAALVVFGAAAFFPALAQTPTCDIVAGPRILGYEGGSGSRHLYRGSGRRHERHQPAGPQAEGQGRELLRDGQLPRHVELPDDGRGGGFQPRRPGRPRPGRPGLRQPQLRRRRHEPLHPHLRWARPAKPRQVPVPGRRLHQLLCDHPRRDVRNDRPRGRRLRQGRRSGHRGPRLARHRLDLLESLHRRQPNAGRPAAHQQRPDAHPARRVRQLERDEGQLRTIRVLHVPLALGNQPRRGRLGQRRRPGCLRRRARRTGTAGARSRCSSTTAREFFRGIRPPGIPIRRQQAFFMAAPASPSGTTTATTSWTL